MYADGWCEAPAHLVDVVQALQRVLELVLAGVGRHVDQDAAAEGRGHTRRGGQLDGEPTLVSTTGEGLHLAGAAVVGVAARVEHEGRRALHHHGGGEGHHDRDLLLAPQV